MQRQLDEDYIFTKELGDLWKGHKKIQCMIKVQKLYATQA